MSLWARIFVASAWVTMAFAALIATDARGMCSGLVWTEFLRIPDVKLFWRTQRGVIMINKRILI